MGAVDNDEAKGVLKTVTNALNIRMDEQLKQDFERICEELGLNMTTAITIFAKKMSREKRIPFEVSLDPFYSESNLAHLRRGVKALNAGLGTEHELIGDDDEEDMV
jgi:DNA-damage-inducible protein J